MVGPALRELLWSLAETPTAERSPEQQALFEELALLFAASARPEADQHGGRLHAELRSRLNIHDLRTAYITRPERRGGITRPELIGGSGKCPCCGQDLP
jgi:hypothetical protein